MKINSNYNKEIQNPEIIIDVSGNIIFYNQSAKDKFKIQIGEDISSLIDIDNIRKLSMFSNKIDVLKTLHPKYKEATVIIFGEGINKSIKLVFRKSYNKGLDDIRQEKNILSVANNIRLSKEKREIFLEDLCKEIKEATVKNGYYLNTYVKNNSFYHNETHLQALILCSIAMMNETSPKKPVDLYITKNSNILEIKVIVRIETMQEAQGAQAVEAMLPWSALRIALIDTICDKNDISYSISVANRQFKAIYRIPEQKAEAATLHSPLVSVFTLQDICSLLSPREDIMVKYEQAEEQEE